MKKHYLKMKPLFNEHGDIEVTKRRMIGGNTTNLNDFNNLKYSWTPPGDEQLLDPGGGQHESGHQGLPQGAHSRRAQGV